MARAQYKTVGDTKCDVETKYTLRLILCLVDNLNIYRPVPSSCSHWHFLASQLSRSAKTGWVTSWETWATHFSCKYYQSWGEFGWLIKRSRWNCCLFSQNRKRSCWCYWSCRVRKEVFFWRKYSIFQGQWGRRWKATELQLNHRGWSIRIFMMQLSPAGFKLSKMNFKIQGGFVERN